MKVPFLDLRAQLPLIRSEIESSFSQIVDNTAFISGKNVAKLEKAFSKLQDISYTLALSSGTDGNHFATLIGNIKYGDEIVIPTNTFIATAEGVSHAGATPVFADVDEKTHNISIESIEKALTSKTKAIIAVHLFGQPADMGPLKDFTHKHGLFLIEDAAQAHCAEYFGERVGGIGDVASWSFYPGKNLGAWGEAGAITTNKKKLFNNAKLLRDHGSGKKYEHEAIGHNYRMSEFQAAVLSVKIKYIEEWTAKRRNNAKQYNERLKEIEQVLIPYENLGCNHVFHLYVIRANERDKLQNFLAEKGIATGLHYPIPLHLTNAYRSLGYKKGAFPVAEKLANVIISLPMYPELTNNQIDYVCDTIKSFYKS